jgi:capsular polysaccharide biosynthesis protein
MVEPTAAYARDLGDYVSIVRRRWLWVVGCLVGGLVLGSLFFLTAQKTYVSTAKVLVQETGVSSQSVGQRTVNDAINLDTEAQLVKSEVVSTRAAELLDSPLSPVALSRRVTVTVPPNTTVMAIAFTARTAAEAQQGASVFAQAYLENRKDTAQAQLDANVKRLKSQIEKSTQDIQDTNVELAKLAGSKETSDRAFLIARRSTLSNQLASYNAELAPMMATEISPGETILEAQVPKRPIDPDPFLILPASLMAGLVVGLVLALWRERVDKRLHDGAEVERLFGLPPLSTLSAPARGGGVRIDHDVRVLYHSLRANGPDGSEALMLIGPDAADTAEHLAYSLALAAARSGAPTTYVTRPHSPLLLDQRRIEAVNTGGLQLPDYEELGLMVDGELRTSNLRQEVRDLRSKRDFLILGLPNDDPAVDVPLLGRHVDMAVLVVRLGTTRRDTLATVLADLSKAGVDHVVAVTVDLGRRRLRRRNVVAEEVFTLPVEESRPRALPVKADDVRPSRQRRHR